jgi:cell division protein ZapA
MAQVMVTVAGRRYRMACDDGEEERLEALGERFDAAVTELRESFGEIGDQRLTVMAGILMTERLEETERRIRGLEAQLETLRDSRNDVLDRLERLEAQFTGALERAAARVERLAGALDPADGDEPER